MKKVLFYVLTEKNLYCVSKQRNLGARDKSNDRSAAVTNANPFSKSDLSGGAQSTYELDEPIKMTEDDSESSRSLKNQEQLTRVNSYI